MPVAISASLSTVGVSSVDFCGSEADRLCLSVLSADGELLAGSPLPDVALLLWHDGINPYFDLQAEWSWPTRVAPVVFDEPGDYVVRVCFVGLPGEEDPVDNWGGHVSDGRAAVPGTAARSWQASAGARGPLSVLALASVPIHVLPRSAEAIDAELWPLLRCELGLGASRAGTSDLPLEGELELLLAARDDAALPYLQAYAIQDRRRAQACLAAIRDIGTDRAARVLGALAEWPDGTGTAARACLAGERAALPWGVRAVVRIREADKR